MDFKTETFTGKLISGIPVTISRMKGYHQEAMFKMIEGTKKKDKSSVLNEIEDIVVERILQLGEHDFTKIEKHEDKVKILKKLQAADYAMALLFLRFFTVDLHFKERWELNEQIKALRAEEKAMNQNEDAYAENLEEVEEKISELKKELEALPPHLFKFKYEYKSTKEEGVLKTEDYEVGMDLGGFAIRYGTIFGDKVDDIAGKSKSRTVLPVTNKTVEWKILDFDTEIKFGEKNKDEKNRTFKTMMEMRNVCTVEPKESGGEVLVQYAFGKGEYLDNDHIVSEIMKNEHKIDTNIALEHPETKEMFKVELMRCASFFFPSGALQ